MVPSEIENDDSHRTRTVICWRKITKQFTGRVSNMAGWGWNRPLKFIFLTRSNVLSENFSKKCFYISTNQKSGIRVVSRRLRILSKDRWLRTERKKMKFPSQKPVVFQHWWGNLIINRPKLTFNVWTWRKMPSSSPSARRMDGTINHSLVIPLWVGLEVRGYHGWANTTPKSLSPIFLPLSSLGIWHYSAFHYHLSLFPCSPCGGKPNLTYWILCYIIFYSVHFHISNLFISHTKVFSLNESNFSIDTNGHLLRISMTCRRNSISSN